MTLTTPSPISDQAAPEIKPIGYVTQYALTHVLAHGGNIPMHPEPLSLANVPVYAAPPASLVSSVLSEDAILAIAIDHGLGTAIVESIVKALPMGGDKS